MPDDSPQLTQTWVTTDGAAGSIDEISRKYLGIPYPNFSGRAETRTLLTIAADSVVPPAR
jgi:hypothetical protein